MNDERLQPASTVAERCSGSDRPNVSVALCTYNGEQYVETLIDSILDQTRPPDELVINDDSSTDATVERLRARLAGAPFEVDIRVNHAQLGSTRNFEAALGRCRGRSIALADQDDVWAPTKLERTVAELEADPTVTLVFSDAELIDHDGRPIGSRLWSTRQIRRTLRAHSVVGEELFAARALTTGCTMVVRRRAVLAALPFPSSLWDPRAPMRHDRWISLVAAAVGTVRALDEPLMSFRVHPAQETGVLIGRERPLAYLRSARRVVHPNSPDAAAWHLARADQLNDAATRADRVGDFYEADTLRRVASHHRRRGTIANSTSLRIRNLLAAVREGAYPPDTRGLAALAADTVRLAVPGRAAEPPVPSVPEAPAADHPDPAAQGDPR